MAIDVLTEQTLDSLVNGVSRQPARSRSSSQCEEQTNVLSDILSGVSRRTPTEHIAKLAGSGAALPVTDGVFTHIINRGDGQQFIVIIEEGDINVFDLSDGSEVVVNDLAFGSPPAYAYLDDYNSPATTTARDMFRATTVADETYIINKTRTVSMSGVASGGRENAHEFLLWGKPGASSGYLNIINLTVGDTTVSNNPTNPITTNEMMDDLMVALCGLGQEDAVNQVGSAGGDVNDWRFTRVSENAIYGYQYQNANVVVSATDEFGDSIHGLATTGTSGEHPNVNKFSDLPGIGRDGFTIEVQGDTESNDDSFYVSYSAADSKWVEAVAPGLDNGFNIGTMPHTLTYDEGTGEFSFSTVVWAERLVGDEDSAVQPSFVGKKLSDILVHENRLMVAAGENVVASEVGDYTNFWPTTVTTLVDSDPLDISGTGNRVAVWDYMVPQRRNLFLFSSIGNTVARLIGSREKPLTLENARIEVVGEYPQTDVVRPVSIRDYLYFTLDRGGHSSLIQFAERDIDLYLQDEVSAHIGDYLPGGLEYMTSSAAEELILFRRSEDPSTIYVYRTHHLGAERVMSSWSKWELASDATIAGMGFIESVLYLLLRRTDGVYLEKMDFGVDDEDRGAGATPLGHRIHLDSLVALSGSYSVVTDTTRWTAPYDLDQNGGEYRLARGGAWGDQRGGTITLDPSSSGTSVAAQGDWSDHPVYLGQVYDSTYTLSEVVMRKSDGGAGRVQGRLQLRRGHFVYSSTGTFDVEVSSVDDGDTYRYPFVPITVGGSSLGLSPLDDGVFEFDIGAHSESVRISVKSDSHLPFELSAFSWEGRFYSRSAGR
jgi:hypothetical protein